VGPMKELKLDKTVLHGKAISELLGVCHTLQPDISQHTPH